MKLGASLLLNFQGLISIPEFINQISFMELTVAELVAEPPYCFIDSIDSRQREEIALTAQNLAIELTIHATFSDINIAAINPNVRDFAVNEIKKCIDFASEINSKLVTIHPGNYGAVGLSYKEKTTEFNFESIEKIVNYAEEQKIKIGLENMPTMPGEQFADRFSPKELSNIAKKINNKYFGITWDVGHSNTMDYCLEEFYNNCKEHLIHLHLHDNDGPGEGWRDLHLELGKGTIKWAELFTILKSNNYNSTMVFELNSWEQVENSMNYIRELD